MDEVNKTSGALAEVQAILELADEKMYQPGNLIFEEGKEDANFYIILKGEVEIQKNTIDKTVKVIAQLGAGEFLGEGSLSGNVVKPTTAKAVSEVTVMTVSLDKFKSLIKDRPNVAIDFLLSVLGSVGGRLSKTNTKLLAIYEMSELTDMYGDDLKNLSINIIQKLISLTESNAGMLLLKNPFSNDYREVYSSSPHLSLEELKELDLSKTQKISRNDGQFMIVDMKELGSIVLKREEGASEYDTYQMRLVILIADLIANNIKEASENASEKAKKMLHQRPIGL